MSPNDAAKLLRRSSSFAEDALAQQLKAELIEGKNIAILYSSGTVKASALRKTRPYARRQISASGERYSSAPAIPYGDPGIINVQQGGFRKKWRVTGPNSNGDSLKGSLINNSEASDFLQDGTRFMIKRPIKEKVESYIEKNIERRMEAALKKALP